MKLTAALFLMIAVLIAGCATTEPYVGPLGPPAIDGTERVWPDIDGKLRRETVVHVANRSPEPLTAVLDCSPSGHGHQARNWQGSRLTLTVPPMTVQHVLLHPRDHVCELQSGEAN